MLVGSLAWRDLLACALPGVLRTQFLQQGSFPFLVLFFGILILLDAVFALHRVSPAFVILEMLSLKA